MAEKFSVALAATVTFDHPTVQAIAAHIAARVAPPTDTAVLPLAAAAGDRHSAEPDVRRIKTQLQEAVAQLLGYAVLGDQPLVEAGLDSIGALLSSATKWLRHTAWESLSSLGIDGLYEAVFENRTVLRLHGCANLPGVLRALQQMWGHASGLGVAMQTLGHHLLRHSVWLCAADAGGRSHRVRRRRRAAQHGFQPLRARAARDGDI